MPRFPTSAVPSAAARGSRTMIPLDEQRAAERDIELAAAGRRFRETMQEALREAEDAQDARARESIFDRALSAASKYDGADPRTTLAYRRYVEEAAGHWKERFDAQSHAIEERNTWDRGWANAEASMESGDIAATERHLSLLQTRFRERREELEAVKGRLPWTVPLRRAKKALYSGDAAGAVALLDGMPLDGATADEAEDAAKLRGVAARQAAHEGEAQYVTIQGEVIKARKLAPAERSAVFDAAIDRVAAMDVSAADKRAFYNFVQAMDKDEPGQTDWAAQVEANRLVLSVDADSAKAEKAAARQGVIALAPRLGPENTAKFLTDLDTRHEAAVDAAAKQAVDFFGHLDDVQQIRLRRELDKRINAADGNVTGREVFEWAADIAPTLGPSRHGHTQKEIDEALGTLSTAELVAEADPDERATVFVDKAKTLLGINWQTTAPEARDIFIRTCPVGSWRFQGVAEQTRTLERIKAMPDPPGWIWEETVQDVAPDVWSKAQKTDDVAEFGAWLTSEYGDWMAEPYRKVSVGPSAPVVGTDAEYDALPSGTVFIGLDGKRRKKP